MASSTAATAGMDATAATTQPQPIVRRFKTTNDVSVPKSSPTVPRRSPGNPRQQSVQILDPEEVLEALNCPKPRGRINSFSPPYSSHSQVAAALIFALTLGVFMSFRLPPAPSDIDFDALRLWTFAALIWLPLLFWLLCVDPRARLPLAGVSVPTGRCKHSCVFEVALKIRHCRKCDKCVAGFDHHCLWLNTCVGTENYHRWLLFLCVLCCWTMLGSWIAFSALLRCRHLRSRRFAVGHRPAVALACTMATLATAWLMMLLVLHAYFSFMGITTLEWATGAPGSAVQLQRCQRLPLTIAEASKAVGEAEASEALGQADAANVAPEFKAEASKALEQEPERGVKPGASDDKDVNPKTAEKDETLENEANGPLNSKEKDLMKGYLQALRNESQQEIEQLKAELQKLQADAMPKDGKPFFPQQWKKDGDDWWRACGDCGGKYFYRQKQCHDCEDRKANELKANEQWKRDEAWKGNITWNNAEGWKAKDTWKNYEAWKPKGHWRSGPW